MPTASKQGFAQRQIRRVEKEWHECYCVTIGWKGDMESSAHVIVRSSALLNWTHSVHKLAQVHKQLRKCTKENFNLHFHCTFHFQCASILANIWNSFPCQAGRASPCINCQLAQGPRFIYCPTHIWPPTIQCNNVVVILTIPFVIWVARYRYRHGFMWWYCIYAALETGVGNIWSCYKVAGLCCRIPWRESHKGTRWFFSGWESTNSQ